MKRSSIPFQPTADLAPVKCEASREKPYGREKESSQVRQECEQECRERNEAKKPRHASFREGRHRREGHEPEAGYRHWTIGSAKERCKDPGAKVAGFPSAREVGTHEVSATGIKLRASRVE